MAQQYYNLEEAAQKLGLSVDALREKAKKKEIRAFQDKGNWRFRAQEIDELARQMGAGSDPDMKLGEAAKKPIPSRPSDSGAIPVDFKFDDDSVPLGMEKGSPGPKSSHRGGKTPAPKPASDSDVRLVMDDAIDISPDSDVRLDEGPRSSARRGADSGVRLDRGSDSDVKLVQPNKDPSDSDIRLDDSPGRSARKGASNIITEEIDLDAEEAKLKEKPAKPGKPIKPRATTQYNPNMPVLPTSSPYELSDSDPDIGEKSGKKPKSTVNDASSEHEMIAFDPDKVRQDLGSGEIPLLSGDEDVDLGGAPAANAGNSGINLKDAADSGISLEDGGSDEFEFDLSLDAESPKKGKAAPAEDSSSEFELSMDASDDGSADPSSSSEFELSIDEGGESSGASSMENSDSEFELSIDDDGGLAAEDSASKDIFEETNFDVPALGDESGSEAVALDGDTDLESGSDFEINLDTDGGDSQVVDVDDDSADDAAATVAKPRKGAATLAKAKKPAAADDSADMDFGEIDEDEPPAKGGKAKKPAAKAKKPAVAQADEDEDEDDLRPAGAEAAPAEWGALPAVILFPSAIVLFVVALMGYELIQGQWGYHRSTKVGRPIIDNIARLFDDKIPKE